MQKSPPPGGNEGLQRANSQLQPAKQPHLTQNPYYRQINQTSHAATPAPAIGDQIRGPPRLAENPRPTPAQPTATQHWQSPGKRSAASRAPKTPAGRGLGAGGHRGASCRELGAAEGAGVIRVSGRVEAGKSNARPRSHPPRRRAPGAAKRGE